MAETIFDSPRPFGPVPPFADVRKRCAGAIYERVRLVRKTRTGWTAIITSGFRKGQQRHFSEADYTFDFPRE